jgi:hypothetical protein
VSKKLPEPLYGCHYCQDEQTWPASDLWWCESKSAFVCDMCWSELDLPDERGTSLEEELTAERDKVVGLMKNFRDGYDCDSDAHKYGTECRCCAAAFFIEGYKHAQKEIVEKLQDPQAVRINMLRGTIATPLEADNARLRAELDTYTRALKAPAWSEDDQPLPEDDEIKKAHPLNNGNFDTYQEALRLVCAKRSKYALIDLVNWLLQPTKESK